MKTIGIRELKATLSQRLQEIRAGEVYWVTDRGAVVAEIRAPGSVISAPADEFERRIASWIREGRAAAGAPNQPQLYAPSPLRCPPGTAQRILDELRADP